MKTHSLCSLALLVICSLAVKAGAQSPPDRPDLVISPSNDHNYRDCLVYGATDTGDELVVYATATKIARPAAPNIVTVFIDDMGFTDLASFHGKGETKNIDRLANEGIRFTNFYVNSPICSPSRTALTTGQYPQRWRITSYLSNRQMNQDRGMDQWLDPKAPILARQLSQAGYSTGHFGKWHMGGQRDVGNAPLITEYGFDRSLTNFEGLGPRVLGYKNAFKGGQPQLQDLGSNKLGRGPIEHLNRSEVTARFVERAIQHIDQSLAKGQPFFVNVWPDDVHSPFFPPEVLRDKTDESKRQLYLAVLKAMDQQLGVLLDRIGNDPKLRDNTLVLVCSDNGHEPGAGNSDPLRGSKGLLYEAGVRSPLIVWGPGLINPAAAGTTNDESIFSAIDINRSLYALTQTVLPDGVTLDGENVIDTILGHSQQSRQAPLFFRRPPDRSTERSRGNRAAAEKLTAPALAVRDSKWKFLMNYDTTHPQLYDLTTDISESNNVQDQHPDVVARLQKALLNWNESLPKDAGDPTYNDVLPLGLGQFVNPIGEGADPWVTRDPNADRYLWCMSEGNTAIAIHTSRTATSLGEKHIVWRAPESGPVSKEVWAPELHFLDGRWHVYFAASDGNNANHLAYVLVSEDQDPLGKYRLHGPLATGDGADGRSPNVWAIDMTVLEYDGRRYAIWSGWDAPGTDQQYLYIAPMKSATELAGPRVRICSNDDFPWEFTENAGQGRGLNEGPQVLQHAERTFVTYSCGASWLPTYKLGMLELKGSDPLDPDAWVKSQTPVFNGTDQTYGVGHSCLVPAADGQSWWHVYHAKLDRKPGWRRGIFVQPMTFSEPDGIPQFGRPLAPGMPQDRDVSPPAAAQSDLSNLLSQPGQWDYFGHHQRLQFNDNEVRLGVQPATPINDFESGEKIVHSSLIAGDIQACVDIEQHSDAQHAQAGVLFRVTGPALGFDAHRGYFAGINVRDGYALLGKMDGKHFQPLQRVEVAMAQDRPVRLCITTTGNQLTVKVDDREVIAFSDDDYRAGSIGLRVVRIDASFSNLQINSADAPN